MFEEIDADAVAVDAALPDWFGQRIRGNVLALADRGPGGGYTWSRQAGGGLVTLVESLPSPVSTHPDVWYSIPFTVAPSPFQTSIRIIVRGTVAGAGVNVRLWCEGAVSGASAAWTSGSSRTLTVAIPRRGAGDDLRCALLVKSEVGSLVDSDALLSATDRFLTAATAAAGSVRRATHQLVELTTTGTGSELYGVQGETRYHAIRAQNNATEDEFEVWPRPDRSLQAGTAVTGITASVYALGTLTLASIQVATITGQVLGIAAVSATSPSQFVRAEWLSRLARSARALLVQPQYAWIGGVAGVTRSTGTTSTAQTAIPYRLWGALVSGNTSPVVVLQTAMRARSGVGGVVVVLMYSSGSALNVTVDFDEGTADASVELGASPGYATDRDRLSDPGTLHWRHSTLTRDQCSSQDLGVHGTELAGYDCDTARLTLVRIVTPWPSGYTPTPGALVRVKVSASCDGDAYIASQTVFELVTDTAALVPQMVSPSIMPLQEILAPSWAAMKDRLDAGYARLLRCVYSEWGDPLCAFTPSLATVSVLTLEYRTSPDLPAGTVLRMTSDSEATTGGTLTLTLTDGVSSDTSVHGARGVLTADLAVTSDTVYTLGVTALLAGGGSVGNIYLLRIEEVTP